MPYIKQDRRDSLNKEDTVSWVFEELMRGVVTPGELNYILTLMIQEYYISKGESYHTFNDIVGALECCKLEVYRRLILEYENKKIKENGDVY